MNREVKKRWAVLLRSGRLKQCKDYEKYWHGGEVPHFCVLGALGQLFEMETGIPIFVGMHGSAHAEVIERRSREFLKWLGMTALTDVNDEDHLLLIKLITYNDAGATFDELAGMIEETL